MEKLIEIERKAIGLLQDAGRYGAYLSLVGFEVAAIADWLETQLPRARQTLRAAAEAALAAASSEISAHMSKSTDDSNPQG